MLEITIKNWEKYKDYLGVKTVPELAEALKVKIETLENWISVDKKPTDYAEQLITEKLNHIVRDNYVQKAYNSGKEMKKVAGDKLKGLRTQLVYYMEYHDRDGCFNTILQLNLLTDISSGFLDILLLDWDEKDKDYPKNGTFYCVLQTFTMALM